MSEKQINPHKVEELRLLMSAILDNSGAGWLRGAEYGLWHLMQVCGGEDGLLRVTFEEAQAMKKLSMDIGGWLWRPYDDDGHPLCGPLYIPMDEWLKKIK